MSILYTVEQKKNPINPEALAKFYLRAKVRGHRTHKQLIKNAVRNTTINEKELEIALSAWFSEVVNSLADGFSVDVAELGTFSIGIKSEGVDTEEQANATKRTGVHITFRPKPEIRKKVDEFTLEKFIP